MAEEVEPSKVLRNADTDERSESAQAGDDHDQTDAALARLQPEHPQTPKTDPEQDLVEWQEKVEPWSPGG